MNPSISLRLLKTLLPIVLACLAAVCDFVTAGSPVIEEFLPRGAQRGREFTIELKGENLADAEEVLFYRTGIQSLGVATAIHKPEPTEKIEASRGGGRGSSRGRVVNAPTGENPNGTVAFKLRASDDCPLGEHPFRVRTRNGLSDIFSLWIGEEPEQKEVEPNDSVETAQKIDLNSTITGKVTDLDTDVFAVDVRQGQDLSIEVEGFRISTQLFDPVLEVFDPQGNVIARVDDTPLGGLDPLISIVAEHTGTYKIQLREASLGGSSRAHYRFHVGEFPRPAALYPAGGQIGDELTVRSIGNTRNTIAATIRMPDRPTTSHPVFFSANGRSAPTPNWLRASPFPNVMELEPNDDHVKATHTYLSGPLACNGIIEKPGDKDLFCTRMQQGDVYDIRVLAASIRSPLDPVLRINGSDGRLLQSNDDADLHDCYLRFVVPQDDEYFVEVADHLDRGQSDFVYRIELTQVKPSVVLSIAEVARYSQERQTVVIPRGGRFAALFAVRRDDCFDPFGIKIEGLPAGVSYTSQPFFPERHLQPVLFQAALDAPIGGSLVSIKAIANASSNPGSTFQGSSAFEQLAPLVLDRRSIYRTVAVDRLAIAVVEKAPVQISVTQPRVPVVRDGLIELRVVAKREPGFDGAIRLKLPYFPPFVEQPNEEADVIEIAEGKTETVFPLIATADADPCLNALVMLGELNLENGSVWIASEFFNLQIEEPLVQLTIDDAASEQGERVMLQGKLKILKPFSGKATLTLKGMPKGMAAPEITIDQNTQTINIPVEVGAETPVSVHNSLYGELTIMKENEAIRHFVARGTTIHVRSHGTPRPSQDSRLTQLRKARGFTP